MMPMWEYEIFMEELNNQIKEENDKQNKEREKYNIPDPKKLSNPQSAAKAYGVNIPKSPSMPKMPKI